MARVSPDGTIDRVVEMPVSKITTCTFGGLDLRTLYVTTASNGAPAHERLAGALFAIATEVQGQRENRFSLTTDGKLGFSRHGALDPQVQR